MHRTMPRVEGGRLYQAEREGDLIVVGTPAWYDWLEHHSSFLFVDLGGGFTARKRGTDPSNLDWEASRTRAGRLWRVSLGPARTLTLSRLQAAAWTLTDEQCLSQTQCEESPCCRHPLQSAGPPGCKLGLSAFKNYTLSIPCGE
jgi:hypothetical protein